MKCYCATQNICSFNCDLKTFSVECIKNLQTEQASLQSENTQFESDTQKLQQKLKVITELYQENEMTLHR